ncbi:MAG: DnaB-like helicase C-terminal domain-containing protein [bacterium]
MAEHVENTFTAYLGAEFQTRLMWQLLVEPEFAERTIPQLSVEYFDDPNLKRLFIIMNEFYDEYEKVPNLQNLSIHQAINTFKSPNNIIEQEALFGVVKKLELWNERIINKEMLHDGEVVQKSTNDFIKQQEYRKLGEYILTKTKNGEIKSKYILGHIEDRISNIMNIGDEEDYGTEITDNIENALKKEFRQTIPTGVQVIDTLTGGGLGKGEIGLILTPSGVGKTTLLTKISNTAYEHGKKVLQIVFEDTVPQVQRKHFAIWSDIGLSKMDEHNDIVTERVKRKGAEIKKDGGKLIIKRFSQEDTTMKDIRNWIIRYQKKWGYKFDLVVLDYLDCLESHKKTNDRNEAELVIIKSFEAMAGDFDIPCWSAIQSNRTGFDAEFVEAHQSGGSIKRIQKAHFFMSVAKTPEQKEANLANIRIIKARFAQDGQTFKDCIFNNDTMQISIEDTRYTNSKVIRNMKKHDTDDIEDMEKKSSELRIHSEISKFSEDKLIEKANNDSVNEGISDGVKNAFGNVIPINTGFDEKKEEINDGVNDEPEKEELQEPPKSEVPQRDINELENMLDDPDEIDKSNDKLHKILTKN